VLILGGPSVGESDLGPGILDRSSGLAATLRKGSNERVVNDYAVENPYDNKEDDGRNASERKFA